MSGRYLCGHQAEQEANARIMAALQREKEDLAAQQEDLARQLDEQKVSRSRTKFACLLNLFTL